MLSGEVMSVLIYGIDNEAKGFPTLIVSSEVNFHTIWEPAINELQLTYIGNQRWLYRKDLDRILEEFNKLLDFSRDKAELDNIYFHVSDIIDKIFDIHKTVCRGCDTIHLRRFVLLYYVAGA